jgi:hypothetical protein
MGMTLEVDPLPPQQEHANAEGGDAPGPSDGGGSGAPTDNAAGEWTEADLAKLKEIIAQPYKMLADSTGDQWIALSDLQQTIIAAPMTSWLPVSWVRGADGQNIPPLLGALVTAAAIVAVSGVRVARWNHEHPDRFVAVPFITRKGVRRGPSTPRPDARARVEDAGRADVTSDRIETAEPVAEPVDDRSVDGGPPADSIDDIKRAYATG